MKYPVEIEKIYKDIKDLSIQGATNVAISTLEGMKEAVRSEVVQDDSLFERIINIGNYLAYARPNEPLAQNGVLYMKYVFSERKGMKLELSKAREMLEDICEEYLQMIATAKSKIIEHNTSKLTYIDHILTHCHSSTANAIIKAIARGDDDFTAVCTETRPRFQGRITAKNLVDARIKTTLIADNAAESFVIGRGSRPVSAIFIGADVITMKGYCVNKIGSWGIAMTAKQADKPLYVVTPLLKIDHDTAYNEVEIEVREDKELWDNAPKGLEMYNPAFEIVDAGLITGFITEYGILKSNEIAGVVQREYPWLFKQKPDK
ncbi:translation initiation factor eIF-2B [bacterium]|nr:translation initiation factor eIF-2B [bacterium]